MKCSHRILVFWTFSFFLELCALQLGKEHSLQPRQAYSRADCNYSSFNNEKNKRNVYLFEIGLPGAAWKKNCRKPDIEPLLENIRDRCTPEWSNNGSQKYLNSIKSSAAGSKCRLEIIITTKPETDQNFPSFDDYDCILRPEPQLDELSLTQYNLPWPSTCHYTKSIEVSLHGKRFTAEEDELLMEERESGKPWNEIVESFPRRTWTSLRDRYRKLVEYLSPNKSSYGTYDEFTPDEDQLLIEAKEADLSWKEITQLFKGRRTTAALQTHYSILTKGPPKTSASSKYNKFTPDEDKLLLEAREAGFSWKEIIELFNGQRTSSSLYSRLRILGGSAIQKKWTPDEDEMLLRAKENGMSMKEITELFKGRRTEGSLQIRFQILRGPTGRKRFTPEEDELLIKSKDNGLAWEKITELFDGQRTLRALKSRFRILRGPAGQKRFTPEEDELLIKSIENGLAWKKITELFKGQRTEGSLRNRYYSLGGRKIQFSYTPDEDKLLLDAKGKGMTYKEIAELFQGRRTAKALQARYLKIIGETV